MLNIHEEYNKSVHQGKNKIYSMQNHDDQTSRLYVILYCNMSRCTELCKNQLKLKLIELLNKNTCIFLKKAS